MVLVRRSLALVLVALVVALPAAAQTGGVDQAAEDAIVALQAEILLLVEINAFESVPPQLAAVHREWLEYTNGYTRDGLLQWLYDVDADGSEALDRLISGGARPSPAIMIALGEIGSEDRLALEAAASIGIPPGEYAAALDNLETNFNGVDALVGPAQRPAAGSAPSATSPAASNTTDPGPNAAPVAASADYPWAAVTGVLLIVMVAGLTMVIVGRQRAMPGGHTGQFDRLLDAGRRMTSALDRREIAAIATEEAAKLADARLAAFVDVAQGRMNLAHETGRLVDERRLGEGALARVGATGRAMRFVSNDEPAITALPASLLVVPVIGQGSVTGILLLVRPDDEPFSDGEEDLVGRLAPMVGSALSAADAHGDIAELTRTDALTGLANRRSLDADLAGALVGLRDGQALGVVMVDVDHFKHFNDTNGHAAGDQALRAVADALRAHIRVGDVAYRYGGEEFSLVLRSVTPDQAIEVAERVRSAVEEISVVGAELQPDGRLTVSMGVALVTGGDVDGVIAEADSALYEAKAQGRNRIVVADLPVATG